MSDPSDRWQYLCSTAGAECPACLQDTDPSTLTRALGPNPIPCLTTWPRGESQSSGFKPQLCHSGHVTEWESHNSSHSNHSLDLLGQVSIACIGIWHLLPGMYFQLGLEVPRQWLRSMVLGADHLSLKPGSSTY